MPASQEPADQVKFLVSCIGHTNNGRPDFAAVAEELGIVSKAAAQKRYERMLKANGVSASKVSKENDAAVATPGVTPAKRKAATPRKAASGKRARGKNVNKKEADGDEVKETKGDDTDSDLSDPPSSLEW